MLRQVGYLVCPLLSNPVSNSPLRADMTSTPMSAWAAPLIIFGTNPACPGASRMVNRFFDVSNEARPHSTVLPYGEHIHTKVCSPPPPQVATCIYYMYVLLFICCVILVANLSLRHCLEANHKNCSLSWGMVNVLCFWDIQLSGNQIDLEANKIHWYI